MAKGRMLNASISASVKAADLASDTHRLIFTWTIAHLDREGRIGGDPRQLRAKVVPLLPHIDVPTVAAALIDMINRGLIVAYVDGSGHKVVAFTGFADEQRGLHREREAASRFGDPSTSIEDLAGVIPPWLSEFAHLCEGPEAAGISPAAPGQTEQKQNEQNRTEGRPARAPAREAPRPSGEAAPAPRSASPKRTPEPKPETPNQIAWRVWRELFARRYGTAFIDTDEDGRHMGRLAKAAARHSAARIETAPEEGPLGAIIERLLRQWFGAYLCDTSPFLTREAHGLRYASRDVHKWGTPWSAAPAPARGGDFRGKYGRPEQGQMGIDEYIPEGV